jgi:hypothetical protein
MGLEPTQQCSKEIRMKSRKHPRYRVEYCGSFSGERRRAPGVILDLSSSGCRARSDSPSSIGECLRVLIDVPRYETPIQVMRAVVRWSKGQEFGIEFTQVKLHDEQRLNQLMRQMAADSALRTLEGSQAEARYRAHSRGGSDEVCGVVNEPNEAGGDC